MISRHTIAKGIKRLVIGKTETYLFRNNKLMFLTGTRPVKRKYINSKNDIVRNDVLQIEYFERHFTAGDVIWDIGSHHGHYSIFCASVAAQPGQVVSFEPDAAARAIQQENIRVNQMDGRVELLDIAVSNVDGELFFRSMGGNANSRLATGNMHMDDTIVVKSKTIDSLLQELQRPTFIKIDAEGAEIDILYGAQHALLDPAIRFVCELHPFAWDAFGRRYDELLQILEPSGRKLLLLDSHKNPADLPYYGTVLF